MAIYGNFKGTTQTSFKVGKSGSAIHSDDNQPTSATQGDVWMDSANTALKIYDGSDWENGQFIGNLSGYLEYKAKAGENLSKGDVVYISGNSGNTPIVSKAQSNNNGAKMPAFGICTQTINSGSTGFIVTQGLITGINTSAFTTGDTLYVGSTIAGGLANVPPAGESYKIQNIGKVVKSSNGGSILVGGAGRFNATSALNEGNIFLGDSSNRSVTANLDVSVGSLGFVKSNPGIGGFVYNQSVAANVWSVSHNLGQQYLNIEIVDDTGNSITGTYGYPTINFVSANQLTATFTTPTAGYLVASSGQGYTGSTGGVGYTGSQGFTNFTVAGDTGTDIVNTGETINIVGVANQIETTVTNNQISMGIVDGANIANLTVTGNLSTEIISTTGNVDAGNVNVTDVIIVAGGAGGTISTGNVDAGNVNVTDVIIVAGGAGGTISTGNVDAGNVNVTDAIVMGAGGAGGTITGADSITANSIIVGNVNVSNDILAGYYVETYLALTGTTVAIDCTAASVFSLTTSGGTTFSFTNVPSTSNTAIRLTLEVTAGGTHTLTWPASVKWAGGSAPDAPASGETNIYDFYTRDAGTTWYGFLSGDAMA